MFAGILLCLGNKAQHSPRYRPVPGYLRRLRNDAELTQRDLGEMLGKPHSWVYNCETGNRRVDVAEFFDWVEACGADPHEAMAKLFPRKAGRRR